MMLYVDIVPYLVAVWVLDQYKRREYGEQLSLKQILSQVACFCTLSALRGPPRSLSPLFSGVNGFGRWTGFVSKLECARSTRCCGQCHPSLYRRRCTV